VVQRREILIPETQLCRSSHWTMPTACPRCQDLFALTETSIRIRSVLREKLQAIDAAV
jgi:hypothetical protein